MAERAKESPEPSSLKCADCGCRQLTLISESECVTIYKCPVCGRLQAPVKNRDRPEATG